MAPRFNVQAFLAEMRVEQREDAQSFRATCEALSQKMDEGFAKTSESMSVHVLEDTKQFGVIDKRLDVVENTRRTSRWLGGLLIAALVAGFIDLLFGHP